MQLHPIDNQETNPINQLAQSVQTTDSRPTSHYKWAELASVLCCCCFSYLDTRSIITLRTVCKTWSIHTHHVAVWNGNQQLTITDRPQLHIHEIITSLPQIHTIILQHSSQVNDQTCQVLARCRHLEHLDLAGCGVSHHIDSCC